ncbi:hypothetical protein HW555_006468, partial [Spodoptera exigua]
LLCHHGSTESEILPVIHSPGFYFDPTTNIFFYTDFWKIVTHIETLILLSHILTKLTSLLTQKSTVSKTNSIKIAPDHCILLISPLYLIRGNITTVCRVTYSMSAYADQFITQIVNSPGLYFDQLLDVRFTNDHWNVITYVDLSHIQPHLENVELLFNQVSKYCDSVASSQKTFANILNTNDKLEIKTQLSLLLNSLESIIITLSFDIDDVNNAILFSKMNVLHPTVLSPMQVYKELELHANRLPRHAELPIPLTLYNVNEIINISDIICYYHESKLILILKIPLVLTQVYNLFENIPLPISYDNKTPNTYILIAPNKQFLAISLDRLFYSQFDSVSECKMIKDKCFVCALSNIYSTIASPSCETILLTDVIDKLPKSCQTRILRGNVDLFHKISSNRWIYVQSEPNKCHIICTGDPSDHVEILFGTGTLHIPKYCKAFYKTLTFIPSDSITSNLTTTISNFSILNDDCCDNFKINKSLHQVPLVKLKEFNSFDSLLKAIRRYLLPKPSTCCIKIYNKNVTKSKPHVTTNVAYTSDSSEAEFDNVSIKSLPIVNNYKRKSDRQSWREEDMKNAIEKVATRKMGLNKAAATFSIPKTTLIYIRRLTKYESTKDLTVATEKKMGRYEKVFNVDQERELASYVKNMENRFFGLTTKDLRRLAYELAEKNKLQHKPEEYSNCKEIFNSIEVLLETNYVKAHSLSHIIFKDAANRFKRALEFGGEILKFFFGTLDAEDARNYDAVIDACEKNDNEIFRLMKDNIHIVKSSINSFNSTITKLNQNKVKLNSQINKLNQILSLLTYYIRRDGILGDNMEILSPSKLFHDLSLKSSSINNKLDFPVPIFFILQIPLIYPIKYVVYKIIPLPTPHDNTNPHTFALITPSKSYIALTDDRLHYSLFDNLQQCSNVNNEHMICPLGSVYSSTNPCCETKLLTEVNLSLPSECNSKLIYGDIDIWQTLNDNKWIYVQSKLNKLTVQCDKSDMKNHPIIGTGILKLTDDCVAFSKTIRLEPSVSTNFVITDQLKVDFDITQDDCCKKDIFNKSRPLLSPLSLSSNHLDLLKHSYNQLDDLENELN